MKKIIALLAALFVMFSLSAEVTLAPVDGGAFAKAASSTNVTDIRALGMGGAGVAVADNYQSIWINPAGLANKKVQFSLPSFGLSLYSPLAISKDIEDLEAVDADVLVNGVLNSLTTGYGKVLDADAQVSFSAGGFGIGVNVKDTIYSYVPKTSTGGVSSKFFNSTSANVVLGFGFSIPIGSVSIDLGVSGGISSLMYTDLVDAQLATGILGADDPEAAVSDLISGLPVAYGYAIPINAGVNVNLPLGFKIGAVARNINGSYKMSQAANIEALEESDEELESFEISVPMTIDAGFAWDISLLGGFLHPIIAADVVDVVGLIKSNDFSQSNLVSHLKAGLEVKGLWIADARIGLDRGYWTAGVGLDLAILRLEAAYYWQEMGAYQGDKPQDALTIKMNLGW